MLYQKISVDSAYLSVQARRKRAANSFGGIIALALFIGSQARHSVRHSVRDYERAVSHRAVPFFPPHLPPFHYVNGESSAYQKRAPGDLPFPSLSRRPVAFVTARKEEG